MTSGHSSSNVTISAGDTLDVQAGGSAVSITLLGAEYVSGVTTDTFVSGGGAQTVFAGGIATGTQVNSGGSEIVSAGGTTSNSVVNGGSEVVSGGQTFNTSVTGGTLEVLYPGADTNAVIYSGGSETVFGWSYNAIVSGGLQLVEALATGTIVRGGLQSVANGGSASSTTVSSGGEQFVGTSALAADAVISNGGTQFVDGFLVVDSRTTIDSGGKQEVGYGIVTKTTVAAGGTALIGGLKFPEYASALGTLISGGGAQEIAGSNGITSGITVSAGGAERVSSGGTLIGATIASGGSVVAASGASLSGLIGFTGPGTLALAAAQNFSGTVGGFTTGDRIDLTGLAFSGTTSGNVVGDVLSATEGGVTQTITFAAGSVPATTVWLAKDAGGGTEVFMCFLAGTHILTPLGEVAVETLRPGDLVTSVSGEQRKLRWIGCGRTLVTPRNRDRASPVVVRRHALADNVPHRDLYITNNHSLYFDGVLIPAKDLINHCSILWDESARVIEYYHLELDSHDAVLAEGAAAETYWDNGDSAQFLNAATRPPAPPQLPFAPVLPPDHPTLRRIWAELAARAGRSHPLLTRDADLHLLADGVRLDAATVADGVWRFRLDGPVADLRIASRSGVPSVVSQQWDHRRLGVALRRIVLAQPRLRRTLHWHDERLVDGFHAAEPVGRQRWTNGRASLPEPSLRRLLAGATVDLHVADTLQFYECAAPEQRSAA